MRLFSPQRIETKEGRTGRAGSAYLRQHSLCLSVAHTKNPTTAYQQSIKLFCLSHTPSPKMHKPVGSSAAEDAAKVDREWKKTPNPRRNKNKKTQTVQKWSNANEVTCEFGGKTPTQAGSFQLKMRQISGPDSRWLISAWVTVAVVAVRAWRR